MEGNGKRKGEEARKKKKKREKRRRSTNAETNQNKSNQHRQNRRNAKRQERKKREQQQDEKNKREEAFHKNRITEITSEKKSVKKGGVKKIIRRDEKGVEGRFGKRNRKSRKKINEKSEEVMRGLEEMRKSWEK